MNSKLGRPQARRDVAAARGKAPARRRRPSVSERLALPSACLTPTGVAASDGRQLTLRLRRTRSGRGQPGNLHFVGRALCSSGQTGFCRLRGHGTMPAFFVPDLRLDQVSRNDVHALLLLGGLGLLTAFCGWLLWSWAGVLAALAAVAAISYFAPRLPPEAIMRLYRATAIDPSHGGQILQVVKILSARAGLPGPPAVYVIASMTANAFAAGTPGKAVIGITEGLLRRLSLRELTGVLGHEISHIANNDLAVMSLADLMTRFSQMLSYLALFLAIFNLPALLLGDSDVSLLALLLLYLAPTMSSLLQLSLARAREFDADL